MQEGLTADETLAKLLATDAGAGSEGGVVAMNELQQEIQEIIGNLRTAVEDDAWIVCMENIVKLLPYVKQPDVIKIIARQAQRVLLDLSQTHPQDEELGRSVEAFADVTSLETLERQGHSIHIQLDKYRDWPGVGNFRNALSGIPTLLEYPNHSNDYNRAVGYVLGLMIVASEMNRYWGGEPDFSKIFFGSDEQALLNMVANEHLDPRSVEIRKLLWTELVNEIEMKLRLGDQID